ncbi:MAG: hypothetical protein O4805_20510 [Trichodesmium sp. St16_bin2-tuft]|nr:hypothetical protein [Trichodesmium sp. St18_bin1]MDE5089371.1 hypothetical protein [Trichodesmium sp. St16_bin2-tuft]MDE5124035.1 hypothetical protein [Trichodesmium sp. St19_bin1]
MGYGAPPRGAIAQLFLFKKPSVIQVKIGCILIEEYFNFEIKYFDNNSCLKSLW